MTKRERNRQIERYRQCVTERESKRDRGRKGERTRQKRELNERDNKYITFIQLFSYLFTPFSLFFCSLFFL